MISLDTKIKDILENPAAKGIVEKYLPGISTNPLVELVKGMSLRDVSTMAPAKKLGLTPEVLANIGKDFKKST